MGRFLNPGNEAFRQNVNSEIYVDMTAMIARCNSHINTNQKYMCVSRPRRFGKSTAANMLTAYYGRECNSEKIFENLEISHNTDFSKHLNQYNVLHINIQNFISASQDMAEFLEKLQRYLLRDLLKEYPCYDYLNKDSLPDVMADIFSEVKIPFIVIIDEWDCIFREYKSDNEAQRRYLDFLRNLLKDREYIGLCYMTGILPVKKYGTHSALNMFTEYSMEDPGELWEYTGFTDSQVKMLCNNYNMDIDECRAWYDGYSFSDKKDIYNPKSVVEAMLRGRYGTYWNQTETFEALRIYIDMNFEGLRDAVISMMAGNRVKINTGSFSNDMTTFHNADDILTLLIHLGYLAYDISTSEVYVPDREVMQEFATAVTVSKWDKVFIAIKQSDELLQATWKKDSNAVARGIEAAHLETSHLQYNDENALSYTISLAYYSARQYYSVIRELPAGNGFADVVFIPRKKYADKPAMIVELKWNSSADTAIDQIRKNEYPAGLLDYKDNLLLVGINYDKKTRKHQCIIEGMEEMKK